MLFHNIPRVSLNSQKSVYILRIEDTTNALALEVTSSLFTIFKKSFRSVIYEMKYIPL